MYRLLLLASILSLSIHAFGRQRQNPEAVDKTPAVVSNPVVLSEREVLVEPVSPDTLLPIDSDVRIDTLENGLVYYVRRNTEPSGRAELRLAINAGSVLEDDDQRGLAHFVEHMLFNGTRRFEEHELIDFLERVGMKFGPHVNAYTSFDETVYMLQIPTDSTEIVRKAFDVLEDWAAYATLSNEEIDKERGVIIEEWRLRDQNASGRIRDQILPVLLADSHYKDRLPIGDTTVIKNAPPEALRRFYRDWYRPDLMAVVAVGDFDPDSIEALIHTRFASLPSPEHLRPRPVVDVPGHEETLYKVATDPEYPVSTVSVYFKHEPEPFQTIVDYRDRLIGGLFNRMLNARFAEMAREPNAPFVRAGVSRGRFVRPSTFYSLSAQVQDDSVLVGLEALLTEAARVREHGFTPTELDRAKREFLRSYEHAYNERHHTESVTFADEYVRHYLEGDPIPGIEHEYELVSDLLPEITVQEVNDRVDALLASENRVVIVTMPEKDGLIPPTETALAGVLSAVQAKAVEPYVDDVSEAPLVAVPPEPVQVVAERALPEIGVTEWTLENGVRVVAKPTDFKEDEVRFTAFSPGGHSLAPDSIYLDASNAASLVIRSGAGAFSRTALEKRLAGQVVHVSPYISELEEGFHGSASPRDLETLFQLVYLYATEPRADSSALVDFQNEQKALLANRSATPEGPFQDSLIVALYENHPRRRVPTVGQIESISLDRAHAFYQERFADAGDFTFVFVGSFDPDTLKALSQRYLGALPSTPREETWRDVAPDLPDGPVTKAVRKGQAPQSRVALVFTGPFEYERRNRYVLESLERVLTIRLREELREERAGVYSTLVRAGTSARPDSTYQFFVYFGCDPERVDELVTAVLAEIEEVQCDGVSAEYLAKVKEQQRRERETSLEENAFWVDVLSYYYTFPEEDPLDVLRYDDLVASLSSNDLQEAAQRYLTRDRLVRVVLYPEQTDAAPAETNGR